ncbi:MAG TPA: DUF2252 family protein [Anaerolineales bacterium]|nr:DUF2252 family protein [Anaerolineales bacterium]
MKIFKANRKYEAWLRKKLDVFEDDLALKARLLAKDPFTFLRGTFYRWMQLFPDICKKAADAPVVLSVGDLHAANFGTWRDAKDELVWGVNDFDEAAPLPYTQDLIRLATSVELASETEELKISLVEACDAILDGYSDGLAKGGEPFVMDGDRDWLRKAYVKSEHLVEKYWERLNQCPPPQREPPPEVRSMLAAAFPSAGLEYRTMHRQAGVGSLGRPRFTALAEWQGEFVALEAKALLPSAALWAKKKHKNAEIYYEEVLARAVRRLDPLMKVYEGWVVRGLAPDRCRIELSELGPERDETRMMRAMGWETANIHLGTRAAVKAVLDDLKGRKANWLRRSAEKMAVVTLKDWEMWKIGNVD